MITLAARHGRQNDLPVTALVAVAVGVTTMWVVIVLVARKGSRPEGTSFLRDTVTRFMGLIVIAMGVQFALTGIRGFMNPGG